MMKLKWYDCTEDDEIGPVLPVPATQQSACADLVATFWKPVLSFSVDNEKEFLAVVDPWDQPKRGIMLEPDMRACIPTGWRVIIPHGWQMKLVPRSGLALKFGITLINTPGTIDSDYTDELMVILHNTSNVPYFVSEGDRICQCEMTWNNMQRLHSEVTTDIQELLDHKDTSDRNGGFGHTGKK